MRVFPLETSIHNRPDEINDRSQFGNWEGDLMIFERAQGNANVATLIERKTRYTLRLQEQRPQVAPPHEQADQRDVTPCPLRPGAASPLISGFEFTSWRELHRPAWAPNPGSAIRQAPWQKGSVENMNKRVRRYLPRDTALLSLPNRYIEVDLRAPERHTA